MNKIIGADTENGGRAKGVSRGEADGEKRETGAGTGRKRQKKDISSEKLQPLKTAAERIADMLCSLSGDTELFVISQDEKQQRRVDTKTLKEFSSVIKEISGVICELNGISPLGTPSDGAAVRIEFEGDAEECSR